MPHAVPLSQSAPSSALDEIRSLSKPFAFLFGLLFYAMALITLSAILATLFYSGQSLRISPDHTMISIVAPARITAEVLANSIAIADLPLQTRLVGIVTLGILQWGSLTMLFFHFRELFRLYERGVVFAPANVVRIRRLGFWLIVWGLTPTLGHQICEITGVHDEGWLRLSSVAAVVLGGLLYVVGRVVDLGREIEQDRASFV